MKLQQIHLRNKMNQQITLKRTVTDGKPSKFWDSSLFGMSKENRDKLNRAFLSPQIQPYTQVTLSGGKDPASNNYVIVSVHMWKV